MKDFDPSVPSIVHDRLNDETFEWTPATWQAGYEKHAKQFEPGVIAWDGLLLDGWLPVHDLRPLEMAELGVEGDRGFALLGTDLQEGESEFEKILTDAPPGSSEWRVAALQAISIAHGRLKTRLPDQQFSTFLGESHPDFG